MKAHQPFRRPVRHSLGEGGSFSEVGLFGEQLPKLLTCLAIALGRRRNELNEVLAA